MIPASPMIRGAEVQPTSLALYYVRPTERAPHIIIVTGTGTGGNSSLEFFRSGLGYPLFPIIERETDPPAAAGAAPFADLMLEVKAAFGRTMTRLPVVFGVSRQTLYNWINGETPKGPQQTKLIELAAAARVFSGAHFKPTPAMLDRTVAQGKSFLTLLAEGVDGARTANALMRIVNRSLDARTRLEAALAGEPKARPDVSDVGAPAFYENSK
jgi:hypothetical protein